MTQETLREAVARAICKAEGYSYIPSEHYDRLADAAIATMFERLRTPSEGMTKVGKEIFLGRGQGEGRADWDGYMAQVWQAMLTAFVEEAQK